MPDNASKTPHYHLIRGNDITRCLSPLRTTQSLDEAQSLHVWSNSYPHTGPLDSLPASFYASLNDGSPYDSNASYPQLYNLREYPSHDPLVGSLSTNPYNLTQGSDFATSPQQDTSHRLFPNLNWGGQETYNVNAHDLSVHETEDFQGSIEPIFDSRFERSHGATLDTSMGYIGDVFGSSRDLPLPSTQDESFGALEWNSYSWGEDSDSTVHPWRSPFASRSSTYGSSSSSFEPASSSLNEFYESTSGSSNQTGVATQRYLSCSQCTRRFTRVGDLRRHSRLHCDTQLLYCEVPGCARERGFYRIDKLRDHVRSVHNGDVKLDDKASMSERLIHGRHLQFDVPQQNDAEPVPLICEICNAQFSKPGELQDHKWRKHLRRYKCTQCEAAFNLRSDLLRHQGARHKVDERSFPCTFPGCDATFSRRDNLKRHQQKRHKT